jgi:hypothetical protein
MNCVIHGGVHAYPHCLASERDHSAQNEWLETKENGKTCQIQGEQFSSATSQRVKADQIISTVAQEMAIFLP